MTEQTRQDDVFEIEPRESGGLFVRMPWWLIAFIAMVVTELTAHPAIGVIVLCLKFGWSDFLTAMWLRRRDPNPERGSTCLWFYFCGGLWRVWVWSVVLLVACALSYALADQWAGRAPAGQMPAEGIACVIVTLASSVAVTFLAMAATLIAKRRGIKVWMSRSVGQSRCQDLWPPQPPWNGQNEIRWLLPVVTGVLTMMVAITGFVTVLAVNDIVGRANAPAGQVVGVAAIIVAVLGFVVSPFVIGILGERCCDLVSAATPADCWPELVESTQSHESKQKWP